MARYDLMRFGMDLGMSSKSNFEARGVCDGIASYRCGRTPQRYDSAKKNPIEHGPCAVVARVRRNCCTEDG